MAQEKTSQQIILPSTVAGRADLGRIINELSGLDNFFYQTKLRSPGSNVAAPKLSQSLNVVAETNKISLLDGKQRKNLLETLRSIKEHAPSIHISFAVEAPVPFDQKIVLWIRQNIHPQALVEIGLQPNISIGCILRTTNKIFDMSLKNRFAASKKKLFEDIRGNG